MGLFASEKTVKIYFEEGRIVEKETQDYIEVLEELSFELGEEIKKAVTPKDLVVNADGSYKMNVENSVQVPLNVLVKVIKGWSEQVPVTVENLKKLDNNIINRLWVKLQEMYGLSLR